jgi:hypothetical protein
VPLLANIENLAPAGLDGDCPTNFQLSQGHKHAPEKSEKLELSR